jgi:hypothetical protein
LEKALKEDRGEKIERKRLGVFEMMVAATSTKKKITSIFD